MNETWERAKELFHAVLTADAESRKRLLADADEQVRAEVEGLLQAYAEAPKASVEEGSGARIGRYKLLQEIGQGGFGVVFMAEQLEPVHRKVALKIIKLGMDTKQVVARFEVERQALALMDHPCIAQVYDAGTTDTGRPYFVMELVRGVPVTQYCDQAELDTAARLELFQQICQAVQHAHQKGIIHRDLKPSNVLVTLHDGHPVPKVIDFGVAKATEHRLTERTLFTEFRQMIGTPEYMPPEQAELSGLDVDTRADVYSLGVLLYELLTGTKPIELGPALEKGYEEVVRTIREVDPPRPSTRVSTHGGESQAIARCRSTTERHLGRELRGDLDWIVMKAMEKDRSRRYESASALAADVARHVACQPVLAGPPGTWYRLQKYVRRHRLGVTAAAAVLLALSIGLVFAALGYRDAEVAREQEALQRGMAERKADEAQIEAARARTVRDLIGELLSGGQPFERGSNYTVRALLDDFHGQLTDQLEGQPEVELFLRMTMARAYLGLDEYPLARTQLERARELYAALATKDPDLEHRLGHIDARLQLFRGEFQRAAELFGQLADESCGGREDPDCSMASTLCELGHCFASLMRFDEAREIAIEACRLAEPMEDEGLQLRLEELLAQIEGQSDQFASAEQRLRKIIGWREKLGKPAVPADQQRLALTLIGQGRYQEAEAASRKAIELHLDLIGEHAPGLTQDYFALATACHHLGKFREAQELAQRSLDHARWTGFEEISGTLLLLTDLASQVGDHEAAMRHAEENLARTLRIHGEESVAAVAAFNNLAMALFRARRVEEAETYLRRVLALHQRVEDPDDEITCLVNLGVLLAHKGEHEEAEELCRRGLQLSGERKGDEHPDRAFVLHALGVAVGPRDPVESERHLRAALEVVRESIPEHPLRSKVASDLTLLLHAQGRHEECVDILHESLAAAGRYIDPGAELILGQQRMLVEYAGAAGRPEAAEQASRALLAAGGPSRARWLGALAHALNAKGEHAEAERFARECLLLAEDRPERGPWIDARAALGAALLGRGQLDDAEPHLLAAHAELMVGSEQGEARVLPTSATVRPEAIQSWLVELYQQWDEPEEVAYWQSQCGQ